MASCDCRKFMKGAIQTVFGDGAYLVRPTDPPERCWRTSAGQGELAARGIQTIDDFDGHDVGWPDGVFALGQVTVDDVVKVQKVPQPTRQPDVAEAACIGPAHGTEADTDDVGIIGQRDLVIVREEAQRLGITLTVVEDHGALPTAFLVVVEFAEIGDDMLAWPRHRYEHSRQERSRCVVYRL